MSKTGPTTFAGLLAPTILTLALASPSVKATDLPAFEGRALVTIADGAMLASGYIDGHLGPRRPDLLSVIPLTGAGALQRRDTAVSNSVATWPNVLTLTADGGFALVTEPFGQPEEDAAEFSEIPRGSRITVVDLRDLQAPEIVQEVDAEGPPAAIDVHPSGDLVAATLPFDGRIALYPFTEGRLGEPSSHDLGLDGLSNSFVPEFKWHPSGDFAAVTLGGADLVAFYRFDGQALSPWGDPLRTAPLPGKGAWTPDGRYFVVTTITVTGDMAQLGYGRNASLFTVFAFDGDETPASPPRRANDRSTSYESGPVQHARVTQVPAGMGYVENFAISPDGTWVVGLNMAASWLPQDHPGRTDYSELTLFEFDPETGAMTPHGETRMNGVVLPQGITFDASGQHLAVTAYQGRDGEDGSLAFWRLERGDRPALRPIGDPLPMPRGLHLVELIR
ncbi:lactonase family protein [Algihabitans albus]|uniref:lactonase family protein n=1 Tax=Algihabitans albus TaxID=2164067 RepID=UPI0013C2DAA9|nr:lactonase family protein [Algihabitans albus]